MCGIAGILHFDDRTPRSRLLKAMIANVRHRGPDAAQVVVDGAIGLAHARLSIIDVENGHQPMSTVDGALTVTFNGEIFNYIELREELEKRGHRFRTQSDTEVILHAYREYGPQCVTHFNGQWAFALWDRAQQTLLLSRDRWGIRPLFYTQLGHRFLFASEVKSLFADSTVPRALDPRGINQLFTLWSTLAPTTVFAGICELPPGHNLVVREGKVQTDRYWQLDFSPVDNRLSADDCADQLRELLEDATRLRLRADVPVGAYLSGGLDSSVTAALARQASGERLRTFSVTFAEPEFDESRYQHQMVDFLGVQHQALHCSGADIARVFPEVIRHTERPVLRTAPAPLFVLSRMVHDSGFRVVLTGEGADEVLGGYDLFKEAKVRRFCARQPESSRRMMLFARLYSYLPRLQAQSPAMNRAFFRTTPEDVAHPLFSHMPRWELTAQLKRFLSKQFQQNEDEPGVIDQVEALLPKAYPQWPALSRAQYLEAAILLPGYILSAQGDGVALAHSVEGRFPFLDHRIAELAAQMPPRWKMRGLREKHILKKAARDLVPAELVQRSKQPYRAPDAQSFFDHQTNRAHEEYVEELLSARRLHASGVFCPNAVARLLQKVRRGGALGTKDNMAFVGILSTQLLVDQLIQNFPQANVNGVLWTVDSDPLSRQSTVLNA